MNGYVEKLNGKDFDEAVMVRDLNKFVDFFAAYLREIHNKMEEEVLFDSIRDCGYSMVKMHGGIYMQSDHDQTHTYLDRIRNVVDESQHISNAHAAARTIEKFITFLEIHAFKENTDLFPEMQKKVPEDVQESTSQRVEEFLAKHGEREASLRKIADDLIKTYPFHPDQKKKESNTFANDYDDIDDV
eukprot:CAMPEP_0202685988 /NCGR_PEP_ID=MMETSP1385-20130828/1772_1 /ASSEMBLY_ACC=CAM_ASM_000861 /TAXON_ID=933848 /ORGANISM="Elphidium margaritaceum" /LENGTH=186 /DNA_ID=CAMNT_0049340467 /DNA_START=208 /DNA_END=768 /DNA_ORIENTATION=+